MTWRLDYVFIYFSNLGSGFLEDEWNQIVKRCCIRMYTFGAGFMYADYEHVEEELCLKMHLLCVNWTK